MAIYISRNFNKSLDVLRELGLHIEIYISRNFNKSLDFFALFCAHDIYISRNFNKSLDKSAGP